MNVFLRRCGSVNPAQKTASCEENDATYRLRIKNGKALKRAPERCTTQKYNRPVCKRDNICHRGASLPTAFQIPSCESMVEEQSLRCLDWLSRMRMQRQQGLQVHTYSSNWYVMDSRVLRGSLSWIIRMPLKLVISVQQRVLSEGRAGLTRQQTRTACGRDADIAWPFFAERACQILNLPAVGVE